MAKKKERQGSVGTDKGTRKGWSGRERTRDRENSSLAVVIAE